MRSQEHQNRAPGLTPSNLRSYAVRRGKEDQTQRAETRGASSITLRENTVWPIYTADFSGEANNFYKWNSKGSKFAAGKAYYVSSLTSPSLSALAPDHFPSLHPTLPQASLFGVSGNFMPFPGFDGGRAGLLEAKILVSAVRFRP